MLLWAADAGMTAAATAAKGSLDTLTACLRSCYQSHIFTSRGQERGYSILIINLYLYFYLDTGCVYMNIFVIVAI